MLFDLQHTLYMIISSIITIIILLIAKLKITKTENKDRFLKFWAVATVMVHYSRLWVDYLSTGSATVSASMLFPIYPCNVAMWLLLFCACKKNKQDKLFTFVAEFNFYLGIIGSILGIALNENYASNPTLTSWDILSGLLSHSTMFVGILYLAIGDYIKIRVHNTLSCILGGIFLLIDGYSIITLYRIFNLTPPNCMYLLTSPLPQIKWFNTLFMGFLAVLLVLIFTTITEAIFVNSEDRTWRKIVKFMLKTIKLM